MSIGRQFVLALCLLVACSPPHDPETAKLIATRKDAPVLFTRDTQALAKHRGATWLSIEPLKDWNETPLTLRLSDTRALKRDQAMEYSQDLLTAMLWAANVHREVREFAQQALQHDPHSPVQWNDLALKVSFWNSDGKRYLAPYIGQLVVQHGQITTWVTEDPSQKLVKPVTVTLPAPAIIE